MAEHQTWNALLYFSVMILFALVQNSFFQGHRLAPEEDGAIVYYAITDNIQKILSLDFSNWANRRIFYPESNTLPFTDHFYVHSLIGLPYFALQGDPLDTYDFIFFVQLMIGASGFYFVAKQLRAGILPTIFSGLYFVFLPSFLQTHPHINFYGFTPWLLFCLLKLYETGKPRFVYLSGLTYVLQSAVGIYMQLFLLVVTPVFLLLGVLYLWRVEKLKSFFRRELLVPFLFTLILVASILLMINLPYLEFRQAENAQRSLQAIGYGGASIQSFLPGKERSLGYSGTAAILVALILCVASIHKQFRTEKIAISNITLAMFFTILVFSLGPVLVDTASWRVIELPYYYFYKFHFLFRSIRSPGRFFVLMALPVSVLLLILMSKIDHIRQMSLKTILWIAFGGAILLDIYRPIRFPDQSWVHDLTYVYENVERASGTVLLELPSVFSRNNLMGTGRGIRQDDAYYLFMHIYHRKWTINGSSGFNPGFTRRLVHGIDNVFSDPAKVEEIFRKNQISLVLIHRHRIRPGFEDNYKKFIGHLLRFGHLIHLDKNYALVSIDWSTHWTQPPENRKWFERQWRATSN